MSETSAPSSAMGVLLTDESLNPVWFNVEAVQILSYPQKPTTSKASVVSALGEKIRASLGKQSLRSPCLAELTSGRRRYLCRAFFVTPHGTKNGGPRIAILLERSPRGILTLSKANEQFQLTRREREALECLSVGLDTKEIASSMQISPNTAKVYIRMVMAKMGVSRRVSVLAKIISIKPPSPNTPLIAEHGAEAAMRKPGLTLETNSFDLRI